MRKGIEGAGAGEQEIDESVLIRKTEVAQLLKVSVRTVENLTARGAIPAPLGYRGLPKSICTPVNHVGCHGIPGEKRPVDGDILNIDVTAILDGWHCASSRILHVGDRPVRHGRHGDRNY